MGSNTLETFFRKARKLEVREDEKFKKIRGKEVKEEKL